LDIGLIDLLSINFYCKHTTSALLSQLEQYPNYYERLHLFFGKLPLKGIRINTREAIVEAGRGGKKNKRARIKIQPRF